MKTHEKVNKRFEIVHEARGFGTIDREASKRPFAIFDRKSGALVKGAKGRIRTYKDAETAKMALSGRVIA